MLIRCVGMGMVVREAGVGAEQGALQEEEGGAKRGVPLPPSAERLEAPQGALLPRTPTEVQQTAKSGPPPQAVPATSIFRTW